ncbi:glutamate-cysteine ligase family protein [Stieleria sp. ICT_E10.1]|uniref:carboxylate-amine ligase n=1 Tax=Stieleria sedimenti TaxID=2976331 RepID=UPI00217FD0AD|nr:glutamate-cysteine ligase family protein [Stieleria sedimenti]MCS7465969.1 glutamate-cysteine ligase family protein [Stieleria sedimenti]
MSDRLKLFDAYGIELEYMLVDRDTLGVRPVADVLLASLAGGELTSEYESGPITWSNELALHVIELKTTEPATKIRPLPSRFEKAIRDLGPALDALNVRLMPTGMHPWMDPVAETALWPHQYHEIYHAYDKIFDCHSHGWANVQSVHLNLPFADDQEFGRLHAAVRLVLPLLPALTASSPVVGGNYSGQLDSRMRYYAEHCSKVPSLVGDVIPEPIYDQATYQAEIMDRLFADIRHHDADGALHGEFLNARGAIARFDRGSIELRVMDVQEYPGADVAICAAVIALVKELVAESWTSLDQQKTVSTSLLRGILNDVSERAENAKIDSPDYLKLFGYPRSSCRAGDLWAFLLERMKRNDEVLDSLFAPLQVITDQGTLATRICAALGKKFTLDDLKDVYDEVADSLDHWEPFQP